MNKPSPLIPQGSLPQGAGKGASNVRIAVATIIAIHIVFFGGLLLQGCKRDNNTASLTPTNSVEALTLPVMTNRETLVDTNPAPITAETTTNYQPAGSLSNSGTVANNTISTTEPTGGMAASGQSTEYTIVRNDTLSKIAHAHGTTVGAIAKANPGVDPVKLKVGQKIQLPAAAASTTVASANGILTDPSTMVTPGGSTASVHIVKSGETLTRIAKQHGTTVKALRAANGLKTDRLVAGQKLKLPPHAAATNGGAGGAPGGAVHHAHGR